MRKTININLLQKQGAIKTISNKFLHFALYYLRYIVIVTQIIVIGVFFYRFSIDQKVIDLKESVSQKQEIIKTAQPLIQEAKSIEAKTKVVKTLLDKQKDFTDDFDYIRSTVPQSVILKKLTIGDTSITIEADALSVLNIKMFYEKLKKDQKFKTITLGKIDKRDAVFEFSMNIII